MMKPVPISIDATQDNSIGESHRSETDNPNQTNLNIDNLIIKEN